MTQTEQIKEQVKRIIKGLLPIMQAIETEEGIYPQTSAAVAAHLLVVADLTALVDALQGARVVTQLIASGETNEEVLD